MFDGMRGTRLKDLADSESPGKLSEVGAGSALISSSLIAQAASGHAGLQRTY